MKHTHIPFERYQPAPPPPAALEKCRLAARRQLAAAPLRDTSLRAALHTQAGYLGLWFWLAQAAVLALFGAFILYVPVLWPATGAYTILPLLALAGPVLIVFSAPQLVKSQLFGMEELESACLYPLPRLAALRLLLVGGSDFVVLCGMLLFCGSTAAGWITCAAVLFIPFNLSCIVCFLVLGKLRGTPAALVAAGAVAAIAIACSTAASNVQGDVGHIGLPLLLLSTAICGRLFWMRVERGMKEVL